MLIMMLPIYLHNLFRYPLRQSLTNLNVRKANSEKLRQLLGITHQQEVLSLLHASLPWSA